MQKSARHAPFIQRRSRLVFQGGQVLVMVALLAPVLMAAMGLAIDLSLGMASRRLAQNAADAAAYGGSILIGDNNEDVVTFDSNDIVNAFKDSLKASGAPQTFNLYDPSGTCDGLSTTASNTLGTVDLWAQYIDGSGNAETASNGTSYLCNDSTAIPDGARGIRAKASWPQSTYFGRAVFWNQYTVAGQAAYIINVYNPTQAPLAPFAVWWDPPYGPCYAQQIPATNNLNCSPAPPSHPYLAQNFCIVSVATPPCLANGGQHPKISYPYGPPVGTKVMFYGNSYKNDAGPTNSALGTTIDPDYQLGSNDFKGYFGWTGSQVTCLQSFIGVNGNGNNGNNAQAALQAALTTIPTTDGSHKGVALFALADDAYKTGSVYIGSYDSIPLLVNMDDVYAAGTNGPWYGTVVDWVPTGITQGCSGTPPTGSYITRPAPVQ